MSLLFGVNDLLYFSEFKKREPAFTILLRSIMFIYPSTHA